MARSRRSRRQHSQNRTGILLGLAGVVIAALLVYQVFLRNDSATPTAVGNGATAANVVGGSTTTTAPLEPSLPNGSFDELSLRDPFEQPGGGGGGTTTPTTRPTSTTTVPGTVSTTTTTNPAQNNPTTGAKTDVSLDDIVQENGVSTARIRVGGASYTVIAGQAFAVNYKLVAFTSATCADFEYADSQFNLCVGEQVFK